MTAHPQAARVPLRTARLRRGLTQHDLARLTAVEESTIWRIEHRRHRPRPALALRVARALGHTVDEVEELAPD